jgi:hypothetical protein
LLFFNYGKIFIFFATRLPQGTNSIPLIPRKKQLPKAQKANIRKRTQKNS